MSLYTVDGPHPEGWPAQAAASFVVRMLDGFPCVFGADAVRKGALRLAFIPNGPTRHLELAAALYEFAQVAQEVGKRPSLVCLFEHNPRLTTLEDYREAFWGLLQCLHVEDTAAWPPEISEDPNHPSWEFSFAGMPFFVVANTPLHDKRRSRHSEWFSLTFQPRFAFETLTPEQDAKARKLIRERLATYDSIPPSPELGHYGEILEWHQYFLPDDNEPQSGTCPWHS